MSLEILNFWWFCNSRKLFFSRKLLIKRERQKIKIISLNVLEQREIAREKTFSKWHYDNWTNSLCCKILSWISFCFRQIAEIMCKERALTRSAGPLGGGHCASGFWLGGGDRRVVLLCFVAAVGRGVFGGGGGSCSGCRVGWHSAGKVFFFFLVWAQRPPQRRKCRGVKVWLLFFGSLDTCLNTIFASNNRASFHLWWKEKLVKHRRVWKYYETDCRINWTSV